MTIFFFFGKEKNQTHHLITMVGDVQIKKKNTMVGVYFLKKINK